MLAAVKKLGAELRQPVVSMVDPQAEREEADRDQRQHDRRVAEHGPAREGGDDRRHEAEARQEDDLGLGVAEEPEQVLPRRASAPSAGLKVRPDQPVHDQKAAREHDGGMANTVMNRYSEDRPTSSGMRLSDMPGARCFRIVTISWTMIPSASSVKVTICAQKSERTAIFRSRQRDVDEPAGVGADVQEQSDVDHRAAEQQDPVVEGGEAGKCDLAGADHQRHGVERHRLHADRRQQEHHGRAVQAEQLVVEVGVDEGVFGLRELDAHQYREDARRARRSRTRRDEAPADRLVVRGAEPADEAARHRPGPLQAQSLGRDVLVEASDCCTAP